MAMDCDRAHDSDNWVIIAPGEDVMQGGVIVCPEPHCRSWATWSPEGQPPPPTPTEAELAEYRRIARARA